MGKFRRKQGRRTREANGTGRGHDLRRRVGKYLKSSYLPFAFCLCICLRHACAQHANPKVFHTAASILALTGEQAARGEPAILQGVITCATEYGIYVQDQTAGIWAEWSHATDFSVGDEVEVRGRTGPGLFSPVVVPKSIRKIGRSPLPLPKTVTFEELLTGDEDAQYVRITGVVRSVGLRPDVSPRLRVWMKIAMKGGVIFATLPQKDASAAKQLIDAEVRIDAPASCTKNLKRQITSVLLVAPGMHNVTVVRQPPKDLFAVPSIAIGKLMQYGSGVEIDHRVRVSGIVTYYRPGERLILEQDKDALLVMTVQRSNIKPGDRIDVVGFPALAPSGPFLLDAIYRYTGQGDLPKPTPVTIGDLSSGKLNYNLVSIEGKLLQQISEPYGQVLLLRNGVTLFRADLDGVQNADALKNVQEGSTVRISGISVLDVEGSWNEGGPAASAVHYAILLRSPDGVKEIRPPSWWTTTHPFYLAAMLGILMFVFFALALYGRMERWKLEAVLKERERLAHEIHDTLAQSFAGIGFQMQAIRRAIPDGLPELRQQVDLARALVRHSHKEARRSIEPIRVGSLENVHLVPTLEAAARRMVEGGLVEVSATSTGQPFPLPEKITDALLHIGQEAVANAVRHADPSHLNIAIAYERDSDRVQLTVDDDGCGFEETGDLLGFGLRGMRKRAAAISANLEIASSPKNGTRVHVICPLSSRTTLTSFLKRCSDFVSENGSNGASKQQPDSDLDCR